MNSKVEIPKRKPNYFYVYNKKENKYDDVKYLSQTCLAEGYIQIMPNACIKKLINHFSITLSFLPEHLWCKLKKNTKIEDETYKVIKDGITRYSIVETNQDEIMINLFNELHNRVPSSEKIKYYIDELDETQHNSWLVIRAKYFLKNNHFYKSDPVTSFPEIKLRQ